LKISGFVSTPDYTRSSKKNYHIYINSRSVKCPIFQKAIDMVYKHLTANNKYPFVVLNLEIPPHDVDVNVHPTKKEVRYKNPNQIFNFIYTAIQGGLSNYVEHTTAQNVTGLYSATKQTEVTTEPLHNTNTIIPFPKRQENIYIDEESDTMFIPQGVSPEIPIKQNTSQQTMFNPVQLQEEILKDKVIGQYKDTYILIETEDGLEIVDQHIAEERYNYEKLIEDTNIISQLLFVSDVIEVSSSEAELIKENLEKFERFGYGIEFTKENEIIFRKVPQILAKINPKEIMADILDNIDGDLNNLEEQILRTTACKASVKANTPLSIWQMQEIIKKWRTTKMPYTCPHGRPICHTIPHKEIAGFFQRTK
jgi:DNA mismatch repair protein MutL